MISNLVILFPDTHSFYFGMGRELFETDSWTRRFYKTYQRALGFSMKNEVIYPSEERIISSEKKKLAVFMTSLALYHAWVEHYPTCQHHVIGFESGMITALTADQGLSVKEAISMLKKNTWCCPFFAHPRSDVWNWIDNRNIEDSADMQRALNQAQMNEGTMETMVQSLQEKKTKALLEIGPDRCLYDRIQTMKSNQTIRFSYLEDRLDPSYMVENFEYSKFGNMDYLLRRLLGLAAASKNYASDTKTSSAIISTYDALQRLVEQTLYITDPLDKTKTAIENTVFEAARLLKSLYQLKKTPEEEIEDSLFALEQETLLPVSLIFKSSCTGAK